MDRRDKFSTYNPIINFLFFIGAVVLGMVFVHPAFLACSFVLSAVYYITVKGLGGMKLLAGLIPVFIFMSLINPLFNSRGSIVLFRWLEGRPYTFEALCYGMALGAMFVTVIIWFASYNAVMTSDKFLYIFGKAIPSLSMVLTMVLRLVPNYQRKAMQIASARKSIGKFGETGSWLEKAEDGIVVLSSLTSWALEGGIVTADSMRSRGYGCGRRVSFSIYRFDGRDIVLTLFMAAMIAIVIFCGINGAALAAYTPVMYISPINNVYSAVGISAYFVFLSIPAALNITEGIIWRILRLRI